MEQIKIERINELSRLSRQRELTPEEAEERKALRAEYAASVTRSLQGHLDSIRMDDGDGNLRELKKKDGQGGFS